MLISDSAMFSPPRRRATPRRFIQCGARPVSRNGITNRVLLMARQARVRLSPEAINQLARSIHPTPALASTPLLALFLDVTRYRSSGGGWIRTRERLSSLSVFKTDAIGRSATPPLMLTLSLPLSAGGGGDPTAPEALQKVGRAERRLVHEGRRRHLPGERR